MSAPVSRPRPARRQPRRRVVFVQRTSQTDGLDGISTPPRLAPGSIRRDVYTQINSIPAPPPFGWADNPRIFTNPLRYRVSTRFRRIGNSRAINAALRPIVRRQVAVSTVTRQVGNKPSQPTVRNRLTSFGSRVPPLNQPSPNAQGAS